MEYSAIFLILYILFFALFVYIMICGNIRFHRDGIIGYLYRMITKSIFKFFGKIICFCVPKNKKMPGEDCLGPGGPCRYFVAIFFYIIYTGFALTYLFCVYPKLDLIYTHPKFHRFFSFWVLPWTWVCFFIFQVADPGVINKKNVIGYLKKYPYDGLIYEPGICRTQNIPIVPRSRFDRYTKRRIAYVYFLSSFFS